LAGEGESEGVGERERERERGRVGDWENLPSSFNI